jgi:hypothetical protein
MGRPLKFESPEHIEQLAEKYFEATPFDEWTITGLALALDTSRKVLVEYGEKDEFSNTIKKLKTKIENSYEVSLRKNGRSGDIFALKNFGWKDQTQVEQNVSTTNTVTVVKNYAKPDTEANNGTGVPGGQHHN